jgi:DNA repair photolyase
MTPVETSVEATEAVQRTASEGGDITVTVVPVITGLTEQTDVENVFKHDLRPRIVAYELEVETA